MPLAATRMNKFKAYLVGAISAIVEPIAAILGTLLVLSMRLFLPLMLLIAAAIMIFVVVDEIVPMANSYNKRLTSIGFIIGFIIMMILDLAFK
jgi:ZIP family zinc transporter